MSEQNWQVQEKDVTKNKWNWFSDFRSYYEAKNMLEVYQKYYPKAIFRIVRI